MMQTAYGEHAQTASWSHLLALLSGFLPQQHATLRKNHFHVTLLVKSGQ